MKTKAALENFYMYPVGERQWNNIVVTELSITMWSGNKEQAIKDIEKLKAFLDDFENQTIIQESKG